MPDCPVKIQVLDADPMNYRAAVIGAGRIGLALEGDPLRPKPATHAGMWAAHPQTELVALCDPDPSLRETADELVPGVACYRDAEAMLSAERPDIVSIASHQDTHVQLGLLAVKHGASAVLCEKPLSDDTKEGQELIQAAESAGTRLIVNHARRFDEMLQSLAGRISDGLIGDVLQVTGWYVYGLQSTGTHLVDLLRMLLKSSVGEISWVSGWKNPKDPFHPPGDPCIDAVLGFESGAKAMLQSLNMKDYDCFEVSIFGRTGKVSLDDRGRRAKIYPALDASTRTGFTDLSLEPTETLHTKAESYFASLGDHVIDCLQKNLIPHSTGQDSLQALRILNAVRESADQSGVAIPIRQPA